jgi:cell wall assembly regulator SMI1
MKFDDWQKLPHGPLDRERLKSFEDSLRCVLPDDFRRWLEVVNGGEPTKPCVVVSDVYGISCFHRIYGLHEGADYIQFDRANRILARNLNPGLVAFGDDAGGNQFTVSVRGQDYGAVIFWDHETGDEYVLGGNFAEFNSALRASEEVIPLEEIEVILRKDDPVKLERWMEGRDVNEVDENNRSLLENAALHESICCIRYLHQLGAAPRNAIALLSKQLKYYPEYQATINIIEQLYSNPSNSQPQ